MPSKHVIQLYASKTPDETRKMLAALSSDIRFAIVNLLFSRGKLTFTDIEEELGTAKATLSFHLKPLIRSGLVKHFFEHEFLNERYSFYDLTTMGRNLADSLGAAFNPPSRLYWDKEVKSVSLSPGDTLEVVWSETWSATPSTSTSSTPEEETITIPVSAGRPGQ